MDMVGGSCSRRRIRLWLLRDHFPALLARDRARFPSIPSIEAVLGPVENITVPIPADCTDGFLGAYWRRPAAYLDRGLREGMSAFAPGGINLTSAFSLLHQ